MHIGKVVVTFPTSPDQLPASEVAQQVGFDPRSAYLLVGAVGGLGKSLAIWLVDRGARNLVFLSRRANDNDPEGLAVSRELKAMDCSVRMIAGSVNKVDDIKKAIRASPRPIKGVFHLAMAQRVRPPRISVSA